jgi:phosphopantetheinyl transferase
MSVRNFTFQTVEMHSKGIEIIQNDSNVLVSTGEVSDSNSDIGSIKEGLFDKEEYRQITNLAYRNQWLSARKLASECSQLISEPDIILNKNQSGRPYLDNSSLHISLSHNPKNAAVIFSHSACGIDIEIIRDKILRIERKFLNEEELDNFSGNTDQLTILWSVKESLYKMLNTPGIIFREEFHSRKITDQYVEMEISLKSGYQTTIQVPFKIFDGQVLTYCILADTVE